MMKRKPAILELGTVSHGTLRSEDLLDAFLWEAEHLRLTKDERSRVREIRAASKADEDADYWISGDAEEDVNTLQDILGNHVPPYCYFGAHPGDGSDFGVWISESLTDDCVNDDVWRDPGDGSTMPQGKAYRLVVSDHGNMTLYDRHGREIWGVV